MESVHASRSLLPDTMDLADPAVVSGNEQRSTNAASSPVAAPFHLDADACKFARTYSPAGRPGDRPGAPCPSAPGSKARVGRAEVAPTCAERRVEQPPIPQSCLPNVRPSVHRMLAPLEARLNREDLSEKELVAVAESLTALLTGKLPGPLDRFERDGRLAEAKLREWLGAETTLAQAHADLTVADQAALLSSLSWTYLLLMDGVAWWEALLSSQARQKKSATGSESYWLALRAVAAIMPEQALARVPDSLRGKAQEILRTRELGPMREMNLVRVPPGAQTPDRVPARVVFGALTGIFGTEKKFHGQVAAFGWANGPLMRAGALELLERFRQHDVMVHIADSARAGDPWAARTLLLLPHVVAAFGDVLSRDVVAYLDSARQVAKRVEEDVRPTHPDLFEAARKYVKGVLSKIEGMQVGSDQR